MVQVIEQQGGLWGQLGKGFGQGLAEQIPKEVDQYRLSQGLKKLGQQEGLTPFQQFANLASIPGATPQMIQSGSELLRMQGGANSLMNKASQGVPQKTESDYLIEKANQVARPSASGQQQPSPSVTTAQPVKATVENYIPKTFDQLQARAGQLLQNDPGIYQNDPAKAMAAAVQEDQQNQAINAAQQVQRKGQQDVQSRIEGELAKQKEILGAKVPGNVYSNIEDKAIEAVNSGRLTEKQAAKEAGKELDKISREYQELETIGGWKLLSRNPSDNKAAIRASREEFKKRGDLENFADTLIEKNGVSKSKSRYIAYPVSDVKELNNAIMKIPKLEPASISFKKGYPTTEIEDKIPEKTLAVSKQIAPHLTKDASILSVAEELKSRGYDPKIWMDYVDKNRDKLNLTEIQGRELGTRDFYPSLDDMWLFMMSGLDNLVEQ